MLFGLLPTGATATKPYAVLLAQDFPANARQAVAAIRKATAKPESSPGGLLSGGRCSTLKLMAGIMRRYANPEVKARLDRLDLD
jgi:hypothetical protein